MAGNAKKLTYGSSPILVDYAEKDSNGNVIKDTYATISSLNSYVTTANFTWSNLSGKPSFATVATSGNYNDLSNKPSIPTVPTNISAFTNDSGYITSSALSSYATQSWVKSSGQKYTISLSGSTLTIKTNY